MLIDMLKQKLIALDISQYIIICGILHCISSREQKNDANDLQTKNIRKPKTYTNLLKRDCTCPKFK